jgi:hypothetical protein
MIPNSIEKPHDDDQKELRYLPMPLKGGIVFRGLKLHIIKNFIIIIIIWGDENSRQSK